MFLVRYFKYGLTLPKLLTRQGEALWKTLIYFLLLVFIMNFPLTWLAFENNGTKLNFIEENLSASTPDWTTLPSGTINGLTGFTSNDANGQYFVHGDYIYIFGYDETMNYPTDMHQVIFYPDYIHYKDREGNFLSSDGYTGFSTTLNLNSLNVADGEDRVLMFSELGISIEKSYSAYIILYAVLRNQIVQVLATFIFVFILACFVQLFRFGFQKFLSFKDGLNFVIFSSTIPAILSLIFGLILPGFAPVVFNLVLGMIVMIVILVFSRKTFV